VFRALGRELLAASARPGTLGGRIVSARIRPRSIVIWSTIVVVAACNSIWGIDDGRLAEPATQQAGAPNDEPGGSSSTGEGAGSQGAATGEGAAGPTYEREPGGGEAGHGGESTHGGSSNGGSTTSGGSMSGGSMSGGTGGGAGTGPTCSGCKPGQQETETATCGRCGTGSKSHTHTCDNNCTWGAWSAWTVCTQCDEKPYRCCGAGKWEWCYEDDCAWTKDCEACAASSCPGC
jgi:hypothetical protein